MKRRRRGREGRIREGRVGEGRGRGRKTRAGRGMERCEYVTNIIICVYKRCACHNRKQSESSSFPVKQSGGWPGQIALPQDVMSSGGSRYCEQYTHHLLFF